MHVLILHNIPREPPAGGAQSFTESDAGVLREVEAVAAALQRLGHVHRAAGVARLRDVPSAISSGDEEYVFNLVESLAGDPFDAMCVPAVCDAMGRGFSGNGAAAQVLALDKWVAKNVLQSHALPVPWGFVVPVGSAARVPPGCPVARLIVKPVRSDASEGIHADSVVSRDDGVGLSAAVERVHRVCNQAALVEAFVEGREVNVSLLETDGEVRALPLAEIEFHGYEGARPRIVDYAAKWIEDSFEYRNTRRRIPATFGEAADGEIRRCAVGAWRAMGCRDYARVDLRVDAAGTPYVLEVNPNPDISPDAGFAAALEAGGIRYEQFVQILLRNGGCAAPVPRRTRARSEGDDVQIAWSEPGDLDPIVAMVRRTGFFHPHEVDTAREVAETALRDGSGGHYQSYTARRDGRVLGWVCFGPTPCADGTFDVYWLAVDPEVQRQGIGARLMERAEREIAARGGRLSVVETAGRPAYERTRRFYERSGYREAARVPDFYAPGDAKIVYLKRLA